MKAQLQNMIGQDLNLPSPPEIAVKILNTIRRNASGVDELTRIITTDQALTAKMLQIANSGFYGLPKKICSIERALTVLGTNVVKNIALSFVIATDLRSAETGGFDFNSYWRHCVTTAVAAELLCQTLERRSDDIFVTALLENVGMLIIALNKKEAYRRSTDDDLCEERIVAYERRTLGFDHQQVGSVLTDSWGLPKRVSEPIMYHHDPQSAPEKYRAAAFILNFAARLSSIYNGRECAEKVRFLQTELIDHYGLNELQVRGLLDRIAEKSVGILTMFEIEPGEMKPYSQLLQEANEELGKMNLSYEQLVIEYKEAKEKSDRLARELKAANLRLNDLVYTDSLTGLFNHRYFQENLAQEITRAGRYKLSLALIVFDIDHFKNINDTHGHPAGDQVLINIANAVKRTIRPSDTLARYGGEEFAVILPQTDSAGVKVFAARIRRSVEGVITEYEGSRIMVTISLGGTSSGPGQSGITRDTLYQTADRALYISKNNGRNQATILTMENALSI